MCAAQFAKTCKEREGCGARAFTWERIKHGRTSSRQPLCTNGLNIFASLDCVFYMCRKTSSKTRQAVNTETGCMHGRQATCIHERAFAFTGQDSLGKEETVQVAPPAAVSMSTIKHIAQYRRDNMWQTGKLSSL